MKIKVRPEIQAMSGYVPGEQPHEGSVVKLNTNENPYRASGLVYDEFRAVCDVGLTRYPDPFGNSFRDEAARLFGVTRDWIMCGNGSDDILNVVTRTFVGQGELLRLPKPSYILYKSLAEIQGAYAEEIRFNDNWTLPSCFGDSGTDKMNGKLRLVFLPNPNSPSGTVVSHDELRQIAKELTCPILIDEAYAAFAESDCIPLVKEFPNVMICRTMSKSHALAGLRFGYLIAQPDVIEQTMKVKDSYNCDSLSIAGATAAIRDTEWLQTTRTKILATRKRLTEQMRDLGFKVPNSQANFTWNENPDVPVKPIYEFLKQHGFLVRYMNYDGWGDGLRISVGTDEVTEKCVDMIAEYLRK